MIASFSIYIPFFSSCFGFSVFLPPLVFTSAKLYYLHAPILLVNLFKQDLRHNSNELKRTLSFQVVWYAAIYSRKGPLAAFRIQATFRFD